VAAHPLSTTSGVVGRAPDDATARRERRPQRRAELAGENQSPLRGGCLAGRESPSYRGVHAALHGHEALTHGRDRHGA
jgi:hypothetical protein